MQAKKNKQSGFGLVEVMVSIALMTSVVVALQYLSQAAFRNWQNATNKTIAYNLIQQEIEKIHNLRDKNANNLAVAGTTWDSGIVSKDRTPLPPIDNKIFNETITVENVTVGVPAANTKKKITVKIDWTDSSGSKSLQSITYLTDWRGRY